ncbi:MAG: hypothetical protein GVY36_17455 [Verrucomicrobia bacterium]|jgi:hypothetical protein|nr:hypothetical protein [Verrucomicrobiota bacterium]
MPTSKNRNTPQPKERSKPRISLNKLGEYAAESSPSRRRRIIRDQKHPKDFILPYYDPVRDAVVSYIANDEADLSPLRDAINKLEEEAPSSPWKEQRLQSCLDAIAAFRSQFDAILEREKIYAVPARKTDPASIQINGVEVSVRPDLLVYGKDGRGKEIVGAIKLHFSKGHPLDDTSGKYVATLLHRHVEERLAGDDLHPSRKWCLVLDIFEGERFIAPRSYKRRRENLAAACEEIRSTWPLL